MELLHHERRQKDGDAPVAACVRHIKEPPHGDTPHRAWNLPDADTGAADAFLLDVGLHFLLRMFEAHRFLHDPAQQEHQHRGHDREAEGPLPTVSRHDEQRAGRREDVAGRVEREHDAAGADCAHLLGPHLGGVRGADRQFAGAADAGEEAQEGEDVEIGRQAAERGGQAIEDDGPSERVAAPDAVGEKAESYRADGVADEEDRSDQSDGLDRYVEIVGQYRPEHPVNVDGISVEAIAEARRQRDQKRFTKRNMQTAVDRRLDIGRRLASLAGRCRYRTHATRRRESLLAHLDVSPFFAAASFDGRRHENLFLVVSTNLGRLDHQTRANAVIQEPSPGSTACQLGPSRCKIVPLNAGIERHYQTSLQANGTCSPAAPLSFCCAAINRSAKIAICR